MNPPIEQTKPTEPKPAPKVARYTGEVVYIYAFDVAYDTGAAADPANCSANRWRSSPWMPASAARVSFLLPAADGAPAADGTHRPARPGARRARHQTSAGRRHQHHRARAVRGRSTSKTWWRITICNSATARCTTRCGDWRRTWWRSSRRITCDRIRSLIEEEAYTVFCIAVAAADRRRARR